MTNFSSFLLFSWVKSNSWSRECDYQRKSLLKQKKKSLTIDKMLFLEDKTTSENIYLIIIKFSKWLSEGRNNNFPAISADYESAKFVVCKEEVRKQAEEGENNDIIDTFPLTLSICSITLTYKEWIVSAKKHCGKQETTSLHSWRAKKVALSLHTQQSEQNVNNKSYLTCSYRASAATWSWFICWGQN